MFFLEKRTTKNLEKRTKKNLEKTTTIQRDGVRGNLGFPAGNYVSFFL